MVNKWKKSEIDKAIELNENGYSFEEIGRILNRNTRGVQIKLNRLGYKQNRNKTYELIICEKCKNSFNAPKRYNRKYCSSKCSIEDINNKKKKNDIHTCKNCNKIISKRNNFCNNTCYSDYNKKIIFEKIENNIFILENKDTESKWVKLYLIHKYGEKCMKCDWNYKHPITNTVPIQLNHIDGNSDNNKLDNVELICPNCHSLTPNFGSLNNGNGRLKRRLKRNEQKEKLIL